MELSKPTVSEGEPATRLRFAAGGYHRRDEEDDQDFCNLAHATPNDGASVNRG